MGSVVSTVVMVWICVKGQMALASGELVYPEKPVTTAGCKYAFTPLNSTILHLAYEEPAATKQVLKFVFF